MQVVQVFLAQLDDCMSVVVDELIERPHDFLFALARVSEVGLLDVGDFLISFKLLGGRRAERRTVAACPSRKSS